MGFGYIWPLLWRLSVMGALCIFRNPKLRKTENRRLRNWDTLILF